MRELIDAFEGLRRLTQIIIVALFIFQALLFMNIGAWYEEDRLRDTPLHVYMQSVTVDSLNGPFEIIGDYKWTFNDDTTHLTFIPDDNY